MAANTDPIFPKTPLMAIVQISTANTNRDGTGTLGTLVTGSTSGTKVTQIRVKATATTTAGMIRVFITDVNGANPKLFEEYLVSAITPSATVASFSTVATYADLTLRAGQLIQVSTEKAETFIVTASVGDY